MRINRCTVERLALVAVLLATTVLIRTPGSLGAGSPGASIIFHSSDPDGRGHYTALDPASGAAQALTAPSVSVPRGAVSASGEAVFVACNPASLAGGEAPVSGICRVNIQTGMRELVVDAGTPVQHPTPSPDGSQIVFASGTEADHGLKVTAATGGEIRSLCSGFCPLFRFFDIAWSPDGRRVAFVATTPGSAGHLPQIYVVTVGDSDYTQLTRTGGSEFDPAWSSDGTRLAFASTRTGDTEIWTMNADGSGQRQITARPGFDLDPTWSPDGRYLAFSQRDGGGWRLAIQRADSTGPGRAFHGSGDALDPIWLPGLRIGEPHPPIDSRK